MAKSKSTPSPGVITKVAGAVGDFFRGFLGGGSTDDAIRESGFATAAQVSTAALTGGTEGESRDRQMIYGKWQQMLRDPIVNGALRAHVTAALGGHQTTGAVVFIEPAPGDAGNEALVKEVNDDLACILNSAAFPLAFNGVAWGDAYGRVYARKGIGIVGLCTDETMLPPLVQPYEQGDTTRACVVACGPRQSVTLTMDQIVRLKMPRSAYVPQPMAVEKNWKQKVQEDDIDKLPLMPSLAGGSLLIDSEDQYEQFRTSLLGMVGQRVLDSIDESLFTVQTEGMTKEQREEFITSLTDVLKESKRIADAAVKSGKPLLARIRHILPVFREKQLMQVQGLATAGGGRAGTISIEDVLFNAKMLSGSLGIDLTMLGFADMMSGGLGDGGFFRTSIHAAERSRNIRVALEACFDDLINLHLMHKRGVRYDGVKPWKVNFYGSISALETERQKTAADAMNTGAILVQVLTGVRDLGIKKDAIQLILSKIVLLDEDIAKQLAEALESAPPPGGGGFGGGFGGGGGFDGGGEITDPATGKDVEVA
jgi:hypothetical protein